MLDAMKSKDHGNLPFSPLHISSSLPHPHFPTLPLPLSSLTLPTSFLPLSHPPSLSHHPSLLPCSMSCLHSLSSSPSCCPTRPNLQLSLQWAFFFIPDVPKDSHNHIFWYPVGYISTYLKIRYWCFGPTIPNRWLSLVFGLFDPTFIEQVCDICGFWPSIFQQCCCLTPIKSNYFLSF